MTCQCCGQPVTARNISPRHVYQVGLFEELAPRVVVRYGTIQRAICRSCAARIERAHARRTAARWAALKVA